MESNYANLLMIWDHIPHIYIFLIEIFLLYYLMGEIREAQDYNDHSEN